MSQPGRNDPCRCGSDKKYKKCCGPLDEKRPALVKLASSSQSLKEKNSALVEATVEIFGLKQNWSKVKAGLTDSRIHEFYKFIARVWPVDTDHRQILPAPDSTLRALYLGENEPEMMLENVFRFSLYADQVLVVNPFTNPNVMAEEYNPIVRPGEWRIQTLRLVYQLKLLAPWIEAGLVLLIPDPGDFDRSLRVKTWDLATARLKGWKPSKEDIDQSMIKKRTRRAFLLSPRSYIERTARESDPTLSDDDIRALADSVEQEREDDPLLVNDTLDQMPDQMMAASMGANLELGLYLCHATGAFPYTNVKHRWKEILAAKQELGATGEVWSPLTNAFQQLTFKFLDNIDSHFACAIRQEGRLEGFRSYLRRLWNTVGGEADPSKCESLARDFRDELAEEFAHARGEWDEIDRELVKWATGKAAVAMAGGIFSPAFAVGGLALAGLSEIIQAEMKRREFRLKVPMSVFIDLQRK
jgi:hypothetical protein